MIFSLKFLIKSVLNGLAILLLVELSLRCLPASDGPYTIFDASSKILKFDGNKQRNGFYTSGNLAQRKTRWHINNMGWNSDIDYSDHGERPVLALIGNSYVEGFPVDVDKGLAGTLQKKLQSAVDCYGFGYSGSKLSQYLNISRYVEKTIHPKIMAFFLFDADVLGSLVPMGQPPQYTLFFQNSKAGITETPIKNFEPHWAKRIYGKLALVRYFSSNKQQTFGEQSPAKSKALDLAEIDKYYKVTEYAFEKIRGENPETTIMIILDAPRRDIYRGEISPRSSQSRSIITDVSKKNGFHVIDLTNHMAGLYQQNHIRFNFRNDYHWNEYGIEVVADQVHQYMIKSGMLDRK